MSEPLQEPQAIAAQSDAEFGPILMSHMSHSPARPLVLTFSESECAHTLWELKVRPFKAALSIGSRHEANCSMRLAELRTDCQYALPAQDHANSPFFTPIWQQRRGSAAQAAVSADLTLIGRESGLVHLLQARTSCSTVLSYYAAPIP